ncbi:MAG TPA: NB-ARC domain-containing protein [Nostocaceae cyanobacterium]|nr:NB-ARC domain-containing protein [Nostocaceae cyanobacterium]
MTKQKSTRRRGVILTKVGFQKLQAAKEKLESENNFHKRYTLQDLSLLIGLDRDTLVKVFGCQVGVDRKTLHSCFQAFGLLLEPSDYSLPLLPNSGRRDDNNILNQSLDAKQDWSEAPDVSTFVGREAELATLQQWILNNHCRCVMLLGMVGMGKTYLSVKLAARVQNEFKFVVWRSLSNAPKLKNLLLDIISSISHENEASLPKTVHGRISILLSYLQKYRCLLILDHVDKILPGSACSSKYYRSGYEEYGQFFMQLGEICHNSCLILTSRTKPKEMGRLAGEFLPVRLMQLKGLQVPDVQEIFKAKGLFSGAIEEWKQLVKIYVGNPLALNIVGTTIHKLFDGQLAEFLNHSTVVFGEIYHILQEEFQRLSDTEKQIIKWLTNQHKPASLLELREQMSPPISPQRMLEALEALQERSLIEKVSVTLEARNTTLFTVSSMAKEFYTGQLTKLPINSSLTSKKLLQDTNHCTQGKNGNFDLILQT